MIAFLLSRKLAAAKEKLEKHQGEGERVAALEEQVREMSNFFAHLVKIFQSIANF